MNSDNLAADTASLRVPSYVIADLESFRHHEPPIAVWFLHDADATAIGCPLNHSMPKQGKHES
jgi:hypothetical protein